MATYFTSGRRSRGESGSRRSSLVHSPRSSLLSAAALTPVFRWRSGSSSTSNNNNSPPSPSSASLAPLEELLGDAMKRAELEQDLQLLPEDLPALHQVRFVAMVIEYEEEDDPRAKHTLATTIRAMFLDASAPCSLNIPLLFSSEARDLATLKLPVLQHLAHNNKVKYTLLHHVLLDSQFVH